MGDEFVRLQGQVFRLSDEGQYHEALALAERSLSRFPEREGRLRYWIGCLHASLGEHDRAMRVLCEAVARGHWWAERMLRADPDLEPLRGTPEFAALVAACRRLEEAAAATTQAELVVLSPTGAGGPRPLVLALHGAADNAEDFAIHWTPLLRDGFVVALPQSSQPMRSDGYWWGNRAKAHREVADAFDAVMARHAIDGVVLAGFSQGAAVAIEIALAGAVPCRGVVAVAPAVRDVEALEPRMAGARERGVRLWLVTGERDRDLEHTTRLAAALERHAIGCALTVVPGLGHAFPPDFETRLERAVAFVLG